MSWLVTRFLDSVRSSVLWTRAIGYFRSGKSQDAIDAIMAMGRLSPLSPVHLAYLGQIYVYEGKSDVAKLHFTRAAEGTSQKDSCYEQYINAYSLIYIETIDTGEIPHQAIDAARQIECGSSLKRWLPLSKEDLTFSARHFFDLR